MQRLSSVVVFPFLLATVFAQDPVPSEKPAGEAPKSEAQKSEAPETEARDPAKKPADAAPKTLELGKRVDGTLILKDIDGKDVRAADLMGKVTVVNFYSIQCPVQAQWDNRLAAIQEDFADKGVVFLHVNSNVTEIGKEPPKVEGDAKPYDAIRQHLADKELPFRVLVDHGNKVADLFAATSTPHVYVFGNDGKLVYKGLVDDDQRDAKKDTRKNYLRDVLGKLVAGETVEPSATQEVGCSIKRDGANGNGRRPRGEGRRRREGGGEGRGGEGRGTSNGG